MRMGSTLPLEWVERWYKENWHIKRAQSYNIDLYIYILLNISKILMQEKPHKLQISKFKRGLSPSFVTLT